MLVVTVLVLVLSANLGLDYFRLKPGRLSVRPIIAQHARPGFKLTLGQGNGGQDGVLVDDGSVVDLLVDGDGGVNVGVLDGLTVDDGLDGLVDLRTTK